MLQRLRFGTLAAMAFAWLGSACTYRDGLHGGPIDHVDPYYTTVDADITLSTALGDGAGLFVEYRRGGTWRFWTSCDTRVTGLGCNFRLLVYPRGGTVSVVGVDLEEGDRIDRYDDGVIEWWTTTALDSDALELVSAPGELLDLELELDGFVDPSYLVWYGNGVLHEGAPRSPVVFQPDAP